MKYVPIIEILAIKEATRAIQYEFITTAVKDSRDDIRVLLLELASIKERLVAIEVLLNKKIGPNKEP